MEILGYALFGILLIILIRGPIGRLLGDLTNGDWESIKKGLWWKNYWRDVKAAREEQNKK
ncbi:hypothetical protein [Pseudothermotoga thermarum]|uniref:Uncharacterized protein n=1 Tax=Pseudothermotoga thermarum DSM 5069 TaxID=688269 RepID=F7YTL5_9THEM|nr:hypothetical protein [Pseudothermotoga thermarum]AEH51237.1 hypothetical protein Theth_1165 [Pseudothermotoga thermarum DSM 5069]